MAGDSDYQGTDDPRSRDAKAGPPKQKRAPDPGKVTNADTAGVTPNIAGKRTNTDGMQADATNGVGKSTQVDATEGKDKGKDGKDKGGPALNGGGGNAQSKNAKDTDHSNANPTTVGKQTNVASSSNGNANGKGKAGGKDAKTGKPAATAQVASNNANNAKAAKSDNNAFYQAKQVAPADRVDASPAPTYQPLTAAAPKSNKNLDDKWQAETGLTVAQHHAAIVAELARVDEAVRHATQELSSSVDRHVTQVRAEVQRQVDGFTTALIAPGKERIENAYGALASGIDGAEKQALDQIKKHKATGLAQIQEAKTRNAGALDGKFKNAKTVADGVIKQNVPNASNAIKQFAAGIPGWVKDAKTLTSDKAAEAGNSFKPESFMGATDLAGGLKALTEEVKKQHAVNHGKKLGAEYERTLIGWGRNADKKADEVVNNALLSSKTELEAALDVASTHSKQAVDDADKSTTEKLNGDEKAASDAVTAARTNSTKKFDSEKTAAVNAADAAGKVLTDNTQNAGTELTDRIQKKATDASKSYLAVAKDLQKAIRPGVPQKIGDLQPTIENAKAQITKLHADNLADLEKMTTESSAQLTTTITGFQTAYTAAIVDRENAAKKLQTDVLADFGKAATDMGSSIANVGKTFDDTTTKESAKIDFAIAEFHKGADAALKDFGNKVKQQLEQDRTALYDNLKVNANADTIKKESEKDASAEVSAKQKSIDKNATELRAAMDGWGTDEGKIFGVLRKLGHGEVTYLHAAYNDHYANHAKDGKTALVYDFSDELSGNDFKIAMGYLNHQREASLKLELADSKGFFNDDEARIEEVLRNSDQKEIEFLTTNPEAKKVVDEVKDHLGGADLDVMNALLDKDVDKESRETKANAVRLFETMDGWGTDEAKMKSLLEAAKEPEERLRLRAAFNQYATSKGWDGGDGGAKGESDDALTRAIKDDTGGGEQAVMLAVAKTDQVKTEVAAAKLYQAAEGAGTDEDQLFEALDDEEYAKLWKAETDPAARKKLEDKRRAQLDKDLQVASDNKYKSVDGLIDDEMDRSQLVWEEIESGTRKDGTKVSAEDKQAARTYVPWITAQRKLQTGQAEPELMIAYCCWGFKGTDEEGLNKAISNGGEPKSIAECKALNASFQRIWGVPLVTRNELADLKWGDPEQTKTGPAPDGLLSDELSGKDWNKTRQLMAGKPETAEQLRYISLLRKEYATSGLIGGALMTVGQGVGYTSAKSDAEAQQKRFDDAYAASFKSNPKAKLADTKAGQELERLGDYLASDYEAYSSALSALVDGLVTALEVVGAVVITVLTAGTAAPFTAALLYNLALSAVTISLKAAALGDQYGTGDLMADVVKAAGSAAFAGIGELGAIEHVSEAAGSAGAKGINSLLKLTDTAVAKAGLKKGAGGLLEMTPKSVDKVSKIIAAGAKNIVVSSGQEVFNTLTDEKTYSMKLEDVVWGENSLGKRLLTNAPKAFAQGVVTQWINQVAGVSNRDNIGRLKKPLPNALGNALAEMGGATAGFFTYLDNYGDAEKFWRQLLLQNVQSGIGGFAQGVAMHKTRAKKSGRDFLNKKLPVGELSELYKALDPAEVAELAHFVEKYGQPADVAMLPPEFRAHTSAGTATPANNNAAPAQHNANNNTANTNNNNAANNNNVPDGAGAGGGVPELETAATGKTPGDDPQLKAKQEQDEAKQRQDDAETKRHQAEAAAEQKKQQDREAAERRQRDEAEAKRKHDEAEVAAKKQAEDDARQAEQKRLAQEEAARKKADAEALAKKQQEEAAAKQKRDAEQTAAKKRQAEEDEAYRQKQAEDAKVKEHDVEAAWQQKAADEAAAKKKRVQQQEQEQLELSSEELAPLGDVDAGRKRDKKRRSRNEELETDELEGQDLTDPERKAKKQQRAEEKDQSLDEEHDGQKAAADRRRQAELLDLATQAYGDYSGKIDGAKALLETIVGDLGEVQGRAKEPESAANRLKRAEDNFGAKITDVASAKDNLWDALGTRIVVSGKPDEVGTVMRKLAEAVQAGKLKIVQSNSNHGEGVAPYMTQSDIDMLAAATGGAMEHGAGEVKTAPKDKSAFTSGLIFVQYPDGTRGEIQIIGKKVLEVAAIEHIPYDVSIDKPLARGIDDKFLPEMKAVTAPIEGAIKSLEKNPAKKAEYDQYLRDLYKHARDAELGIESAPPRLPAGIDEALSADGLKAVYARIEEIKAKAKVGKTPVPGGDEAKQTAETREPDKLSKLDELHARLSSDDAQVRARAQTELEQLRQDPEWKAALELKENVFGSAKASQKGENAQQLSDNLPTLLAEADRARIGKNPVLQAKREKFERALSLAILNEGPVRTKIDAELGRLCEKAFDYLSKTRQGEDLEKSIGGLGLDASKGYGGGVGKNKDVMLDVLANGNIRERMIALANFMEVIGKDALSEKGRANLQKMAADNSQQGGTGQYTAEDAKRLVDRVLAYSENTESKDQSVKGLFKPLADEAKQGGRFEEFEAAKNQNMDTKLPPLVAEKVSTFLGKQLAGDAKGMLSGGEASPLSKTTITVREAIAKGLALSEREIAAAGGLDAPLNWVIGQRANIVDPKAKFIADAKEHSMPLKAGISGTTYRWMMLVEMLGGDKQLGFLAAVGSLQSPDAHSVHEMASAAKGYGIAYDVNNPYSNLGIDRTTLEALAKQTGTTLDELNGVSADAKTGK